MRAVSVEQELEFDVGTIEKIQLNTPPGGWLAGLRAIRWPVTEYNLPYANLFLSPNLEGIRITLSWVHNDSEARKSLLHSVALTIAALPVSRLRCLVIAALDDDVRESLPWEYFTEQLSSIVLRCGPSLRKFGSEIPLSDKAAIHLYSLPDLHVAHFHSPPPDPSNFQPPFVFPPLTGCLFGEGATTGWLSMFQSLEDAAHTAQDTSPLARMKISLRSIRISDDTVPINRSITSQLLMFQKLSLLKMEMYCDEDWCWFELDDNDVRSLAMALPRLKTLILGHPCRRNTCRTTAHSLLSLSNHCAELEKLEVHFNALGFVCHWEEISENPDTNPQRCNLKTLVIHEIPLALALYEAEQVVEGLENIFPSLERVLWKGEETAWHEVSELASWKLVALT